MKRVLGREFNHLTQCYEDDIRPPVPWEIMEPILHSQANMLDLLCVLIMIEKHDKQRTTDYSARH